MCLSVCVCLYLCLSASVSGFFRRDYIASRSDNPKKHADLSFSISLSLSLSLAGTPCVRERAFLYAHTCAHACM